MHGNRTHSENAEKDPHFPTGGAESGALLTDSFENDADLLAVIQAWPTLPESQKVEVMAIVRPAFRP